MSKTKLNKSRDNLKIYRFKAPEWNLQAFLSTSLYLFALSTFIYLAYAGALTVWSQQNKPITFGTEQKVKIFPTEIKSSDWAGVETVLIQDLGEGALYQDFTARNSAYVAVGGYAVPFDPADSEVESILQPTASGTVPVTSPSATSSSLIEPTQDEPEEVEPSTEASTEETAEQSESEEPRDTEIEESQPEKVSEPEPESPVEESNSEPTAFVPQRAYFGILKRVQGVFPLAQLSVTSSTQSSTETGIVEEEPQPEPEPTEEPILHSPPVEPTESESLPDAQDDILSQQSIVEEIASSTTNTSNQSDNNSGQGKKNEPASDLQEIVLANFDTAPLEPGQFINGMRLRLSFAAQLKNPSASSTEYVEVFFGPKNQMESVGRILLDDEVSNALNGGYQLFAIPEVKNVNQFKNLQVALRYHGEKDALDGMFLDAAWLELDTRIVTRDDLKARGKADKLEQLKKPQKSTLVSDQTTFRKDEAPLFNLRYDSQRNFLVRGFRSLTGQDLVKVETVSIKHQGIGPVGVNPIITVTKDGLLTIEVPEDELYRMRPGTYHVELTLDEGGQTFMDGFDFQWGIITINPSKSRYEVGETADISIGALTPNGNTICRANLDLYVIDPLDVVTKVDVYESGLCDGNNVIDVPDFTATFPITEPGVHELYLERLSDDGDVLGYTNDSFNVQPDAKLMIERVGPTRIYPPATYPMTITVETDQSFEGTVVERVPADFVVVTDAQVDIVGEWKTLTWDISILGAGTEVVSYEFDAPDISPYLYTVGPAVLSGRGDDSATQNASTTGTTGSVDYFAEHRRWQIASDAVGNMLLLWANGASMPNADWTCVSCATSDPFYQRLIMGSSTYNVTGGTATHTHTVSTSLLASSNATMEAGSGGPAIVTHSHTLTPTIQNISNYPEYRTLRVIRYTAAAGEPTTIPQGAIALFDVASSSLPANWNRYAAQDGKFVLGASGVGSTAGSNNHSHTVSGTTGGSTGGTARSRGGGTQTTAAADGHTHTISTATGNVNKEPPYVEVLLAQASTDVSPTNGIIAMWTEDVDSGWLDISSDPGSVFSNRFFKATSTYGTTGGNTSHTHADITNAVTSGPSATITGRTGSSGAGPSHTHNVNFTNFSTSNNIPPYATAVFGKRQGTDPVFDQTSSRWYHNENAEPPTDPWPDDAVQTLDLAEREAITATSTPVKNGDEVRLRMNVNVTNASATVGTTFKLQYAAADVCSSATGWADVGDTSSTTVWRGYNNAGETDHQTISSQLLASTTVSATYEENGYATGTPNEIGVDDYGEWDFVLQHNGAAAGTHYCFRMVEGDGSTFLSYSHYPQLYTNEAPFVQSLDKLFDNEKTASTTPYFYFTANDSEGEKIHYQIQVDDDYTFGSPVIDRDTIDDSPQFENQFLISDKAPFRPGELIEFVPSVSLTNNTTYYWRIRGQDPEGSNEWGGWSTVRSFTIDTTLLASAWFQTQDEQFDTNTLAGVETGSDEVDLITGSTTGTMTSTPIDFDDGGQGTAWASFSFNDTETAGDIKYQIQYLDNTSTWTLIPNVDLSGNSSGFDTSPVSLLNLDVSTYNQIRIVANFTDSSGSPSLQDWTVNWGYRVETPTITKLFQNEQVGTSTPTFQFTTSDPQGDSLTYQIQWSLTPDFAASTTRTSGVNSGFVNLDTASDTDPFNSGADISFTIQSSDALTASTTYWWRVRAKDTTGDDVYSFWTDARSFTYIPGTEVSTWFQTTEEQFDTNTLSGVDATVGDFVTVATTATEAMIVYGEGAVNTPRYRQWNGTTLTAEGSLQDIGAPLKWAVVEAGTTREEYVAATVGTDNDVNVQVFAVGQWGNLSELTTAMGDINARGFDVAYETLSGDALVAYCDGDSNPSSVTWNGTTWSTSTQITLNSSNNCEWIELASDPVSDEIILLSRDSTGGQYEAMVWNGSAWGNSSGAFGGITEDAHAGMAVEYEEGGGQAIVVSSDGNPARFRYDIWNGTTWAGDTTFSIGDDFEWGQLVRDIGSDQMLLCYQDEDQDIGVVRWTGSAWAGQTELDVDGNAKNDPAFSCVFEDTAGRNAFSMVVVGNTTQTNYHTWNTSTWSGGTQVNSLGDSATMQLKRTGNALVLGVFFDDPNDTLRFSTWNGSSWSTTTNLESNASVDSTPFGQPYSIAPRNSGTEGTVIVSPALDFNDGLGPYWDEFRWNDSQPGSSEIRYYVQYQTSTGTWAFIPNADLPGNESGTTTGPIDLSNLNTNTYNVIRPYAELMCDGGGACPSLFDWTITWAGGITVSGSIFQYDEIASTTSGTVAVAVNGVLQTSKVGTVSNGSWSIDNVTTFPGDIVTVFVDGANDENEAVGVTRYDGQGNIDGMVLYERHLTLGSNDATSTPLTNTEIGQYTNVNDEDVFIGLSGTVLNACATTGCSDVEVHILPNQIYAPGGRLLTHDLENNGTIITTNVIELTGSWDNNATSTLTGSTIYLSATSSTESVDSSGAVSGSFNNLVFGSTTGSGVWTLGSTLDVDGNLTVNRGTLARGSTEVTVAGNLSTAVNGTWSGLGTTTFDGSVARTWSDATVTGANVGRVVVDGAGKIVNLASNVTAQSITIGANDTLDVTASNHDITLYGSWNNQNNFLARAGEVFFAATTTGHTITTAGDVFYDLTFNGVGGVWSFTESTLLVGSDLTVATGTVTLPSNGTTTISGSFDATGGTFQNNNGTILFNSNSAETLTFAGGQFTNVAHNLTFDGSGSWTITDTNATSTNDIRVKQGTVNFPTGVLAIGGSLIDAGGVFVGGTGTTRFYSTASEVVVTDTSSLGSVVFDGTGDWTFTSTNADIDHDLLVVSGTVTLPGGILSIGGSYSNAGTVNANSGTVTFDASTSGETINFGASNLYDVVFNGLGGWTITNSATTTNTLTLTNVGSFTLTNGEALSVGGVFTNAVGGASTTWTGTTLSLESGDYSINTKAVAGDTYDTLRVAANTHIKMWNSAAATYLVNPTGSVYSQDNLAVDGDLYIYGAYQNNGGNEYWRYDTDFDGTDLTASSSERQVDVRFASGASASFASTTFEVVGIGSASTTVTNQGAGTYTIAVDGGTTTMQHYNVTDLGGTGITLSGGGVVTSLDDGYLQVAAAAGSAFTLSSTTIDANPSKQLFRIAFATTSAISATNVTQTDGTPASYWWFRNGYGNLYGENFDNDTGDPGSVRFDDSSLVLTLSGTVYSDGGATPLVGGTCDGSTPVIDVYVGGVYSTSASCSNVDGSYSAPGVVVVGDPTITVYLNDASGGERGSVITRTPTADITDMDIYANRVIVRNEDTQPLTIANLAVLDSTFDSDLQFEAATTSGNTLTVFAGNELHVFATSTFTPGGPVTLNANSQANGYDGTLYLANGASFVGNGTTTYTIGGRMVLESGAAFFAASSTVNFTATTTGKSISALNGITFYDLDFTGVGGGWNLGANISVIGDMSLATGTVTGTGDITIPTGELSGNGTLSMGGGTTTIGRTNSLGGPENWTFYDLTLGDGLVVGTTTPLFVGTTTVANRLTVSAAHYLDAGSTVWNLSGTGNVFVETGTFIEDTSTIRYSGNGATILSTQYYNLDVNAGAGTPSYTVSGFGIIVDGDLFIGGDAPSTFDQNTTDGLVDINGDVLIRNNGTFSQSNSASTTIAGSYDNNGSFTGNGGTLTFDGAGVIDIAAGASSFSSVRIDATGDVTVSEHATTTNVFTIANANSFTLTSGESLAVGGSFFNGLDEADTTWTGSTLRLYGGNIYTINTKSTSDTYATLDIDGTTQPRLWNSSAATYDVATTASLYSQDHAGVNGDLYIWGAYSQTNANDFWSYARDFDGMSLSGSERKVDVYFATDASALITGGNFSVIGGQSASTTIQAQGSNTYGLTIGGNASTTFRYYEIRDIDSNGLTFTATPDVNGLSFGDLEVSQNGGTAMTVGGTVITANPAQNFTFNRFALSGVGSGFNVTATGTSVSSWRFTNHYGDIDGEANDVDPDGDPGYVVWDDSAASITIAGTVYTGEGSGTPGVGVCNGSLNAVRIVVAGLTTYNTSCGTGTGNFSVSGITYSPGDSIIAFLTPVTGEQGATVTIDPISNINNFDIYWNRVIVRHENTDPITIADMAVYDSSDEANIPFTAVDAGTDTLTLPADRKLIVWTGKEFAPNGNVTVTNGGSQSYGGSLQLYANAQWTGQGTESLAIGGNIVLDANADFTASNGTTTFTTSGAGRTIDLNESALNNVAFTGSGSWTITDPTFTATGDFTQTAGTLTMPTGTTTVSGHFVASGGSFDANTGLLVLDGSGSRTLIAGGSDLAELRFAGGNYTFGDTNATATEQVEILSGTITLPSGSLAVGGSFLNTSGVITHNTSELIFTNATSASVLASSSDLYAATFNGGGTYDFIDDSLTFLDSLTLSSGSLTLASGTLSIGGSFDASGGTFTHATGTVLFNSSDTGEIIDAGGNDFYRVQISAPTGGYTIVSNATTTNTFSLVSASSFTLQSGATLTSEGTFFNYVGGANTTWTGSTVKLDGQNAFTINSTSTPTEQYETLIIGQNSDIRAWNTAATTTVVDSTASHYSQDHGGANGALNIFGDFHISTTTEYWSYATDFNGTSLSGGSERPVTVSIAQNATTSVDGGTLQMVGASGNVTTVTNQSTGTYAFIVSAGTFNAQHYALRNLNTSGLQFLSAPTIVSLNNGDYELAVNGGTLISLSSSTLNANASLVITDNRFATTTAITGDNVTLTGSTSNAWTYVSHTGNLDGEDYDVDGATACGQIRWADSACLITQQTHYRWRNDDGGLGVPNTEWYNASWDARKRVRIDNPNSTTTVNAVVELTVVYDSDMQSDFDDLRFTAADGITPLSYWIGSTTASVMAEVWVKIPSLTANDATIVYMYYNNPSVTSSSSASSTFAAADDFEDGNISEYSGPGDLSLFSAGTSPVYDGSNSLTVDVNGRSINGGIYRNDVTVQRGQTFQAQVYVDESSIDDVCTLFATQAQEQNYGVCFRLNGTDRISLVEDAQDNDTSAPVTILSSTLQDFPVDGWYEIEVDWASDGTMDVSVYQPSGALFATTSATDLTYSSGGIGFTYWLNQGAWDSVHARPTLDTEPTITFGAEQTDGGASWAAAEDTPAVFDTNDVARLRIAIENTGLDITNQQFLLEYAPQGAAPSCEAVSPANFQSVPPQATCGTSPVCMQSSANVTNGAATFDLLTGPAGNFTAGEARESPSNITGNLNVDQGEYTELEYVLTPTSNDVDQNLCFRVTNNGADYDTYLRVAKLLLQFNPVLDTITLNDGNPISLLPGTTTPVLATTTVSDQNGYTDITAATTTFYRSGVGAACTPDNNNCYVSTLAASSCSLVSCSGESCELQCVANIYFHAEATDTGSDYDGQEWFAFTEVNDAAGGYDFNTSIGQELNTLRAISIGGVIDYGALSVNSDTGSINASTTVENQGNVEVDIDIQGTDMSDGVNSTIPSTEQKYATSTFTYSSCGIGCQLLSSTTPAQLDVELGKPTSDTPPVEDAIYWGIAIPIGTNSTAHQGLNVFTPISP